MKPIAVLDHDKGFSERLCALLKERGYRVAAYASVGRLLDGVLKNCPALLVLDPLMPGMDGHEMLRVLRRNPETKLLPIIVVSTAPARPGEIVQGLNDGADEYLAKPFDGKLFIARVEALLRRAADAPGGPASEILAAGPLRMVVEERRVSLGSGPPLQLTHLEYDVLEYFMRHPARVLTRAILLQEVWKEPPGLTTRTVDKHVESLRKKLSDFGSSIETVVGVGYVFRPAPIRPR